MKNKSISVIISTLNDSWLLGAQLESIVSQLSTDDEIVLLDDGSFQPTRDIISLFRDKRIRKFRNETPRGVNKGFNFCASKASKDWILGASGNDLLQPCALYVFRDAVEKFPEARVIAGHCLGHLRPNWTNKTEYIEPKILPLLWRTGRWSIHGAGVFIRRDCWKKGYLEELSYHADGFLTWITALRFGIVNVPYPISAIHMSLSSFSGADRFKDNRDNCLREWIKEFEKPEYDDVRDIGNELINPIVRYLPENKEVKNDKD